MVTRVTYTRNLIDIVENCIKVPVECRSAVLIGLSWLIEMRYGPATYQSI